ncbi:hypothetical protein CMV_004954 [Castanea mollissima]|uniref:Uncharacterized protein n=1 Tax=Castanea mollissima TaxID=60419 RepID=A0A8J4REJ3_9ROSI|nr:hypothetical protein CMV_004954 [Castanea mollissima]
MKVDDPELIGGEAQRSRTYRRRGSTIQTLSAVRLDDPDLIGSEARRFRPYWCALIQPNEDITSIDNIRWAPIYVNAFSAVHVKIKSGPEGTNHSVQKEKPTST